VTTPGSPPPVIADPAVCGVLTRAPAGKRLTPKLATVVPLLRREGEVTLE
jgi:hypothetical protein